MHLKKLEKIRQYAAECARVGDVTTDQATRKSFGRLAERLNVIADQIELERHKRACGLGHSDHLGWRPLSVYARTFWRRLTASERIGR